jgi:hypothetical protein
MLYGKEVLSFFWKKLASVFGFMLVLLVNVFFMLSCANNKNMDII